MLEEIMANLKLWLKEHTGKHSQRPHVLPLVATHIGRNTVYIDTVMLRHLIQTLKAALLPRTPPKV
jgi:hypothetical protein